MSGRRTTERVSEGEWRESRESTSIKTANQEREDALSLFRFVFSLDLLHATERGNWKKKNETENQRVRERIKAG